MKKFILAACLFLGCILFVSCGSSSQNAPESAAIETQHKIDTATEEVRAPESDLQPESSVQAAAEPEEEKAVVAKSDIPEDFVQCEVRGDYQGEVYTAQAAGPTLEEARDNAVEEACSIGCADSIKTAGLSDDDIEKAVDDCVDKNLAKLIVMAVACTQNNISIYTEGAWNENNDAAPTNGEESTGDELANP